MNLVDIITLTDLTTILLFAFLFYFLIKVLRQRCSLYYYGSKLPGPFAWPLLGSAHLFLGKSKDLYHTLIELCQKYPPVFKAWMGPLLMIVNTQPEDLEILLSAHLEKSLIYDISEEMLGQGLVTASVNTWKVHRKVINPVFNNKILISFMDVFIKRSNLLIDELKNHCGKGQFDIHWKIWKCVLEISCETLTDSDPASITEIEQYMRDLMRAEELLTMRTTNILLYSNILWKLSSLSKEMEDICDRMYKLCGRLITKKTREAQDCAADDSMRRNRLINKLVTLDQDKKEYSSKEMLDEINTMLVASSETSAVVQSMFMMMMGLRKDVQDKVYEELYSIFGNSTREATLGDLKRMEYLERVIKETLRLFPPAPFIARKVIEDFELNSVVYPKGTTLFVPIAYVHRSKELWKDPLIFNPDRFLPENSEKRHRCAYIPFSFGPRNCIGLQYGMMSMKVLLSTLLRHYRVVSTNHKSIEDVRLEVHAIIAKPQDDVLVELESR